MTTSLRSSETFTSVTDGAIVEIDGEAPTPPGHDRRRAMVLVFALCLVVCSATVGRDGPEATALNAAAANATAPVEPPQMQSLSRDTSSHCVTPESPDPFAHPSTLVVVTGEPFIPASTVWLATDSVTRVYDRTWAQVLYQFSEENREVGPGQNSAVTCVEGSPSGSPR
jgi:hypothetical protein